MRKDSSSTLPAGLVILGFGGHARSVADVALSMGIQSLCFVDPNAQPGENFLGHPVCTQWEDELPSGWAVFPAAGGNADRLEQYRRIVRQAWPMATLVAPSATVGRGGEIGSGSFVGQQAHIGPAARVGQCCIVNSGAVVDHESSVGDFSHISINTTVAGRCRVGSFVFIGAGATMVDKVNIPDNVTIGAGGLVLRSVDEPGIYVGVPVLKL